MMRKMGKTKVAERNLSDSKDKKAKTKNWRKKSTL